MPHSKPYKVIPRNRINYGGQGPRADQGRRLRDTFYSFFALVRYAKTQETRMRIFQEPWLIEAIRQSSTLDKQIGQTISKKSVIFQTNKGLDSEVKLIAALQTSIQLAGLTPVEAIFRISNRNIEPAGIRETPQQQKGDTEFFIRVAWSPFRRDWWNVANGIVINTFRIDGKRIILLVALHLKPKTIKFEGTERFQNTFKLHFGALELNSKVASTLKPWTQSCES